MKNEERRDKRENLYKPIIANCQQRSVFINNLAINNWNSMPDWLVEAINTNVFKNRLDNFQHRFNSSHSTDWVLQVRQ